MVWVATWLVCFISESTVLCYGVHAHATVPGELGQLIIAHHSTNAAKLDASLGCFLPGEGDVTYRA